MQGKLKITPQGSGGSTENLRKIEGGRTNMAVVHSGDLYLGRRGKLNRDPKKYTRALAVATLYHSAAQLVTSNKKITSISQVKGLRVGIGGAGSGAAATAKRFFEQIKVWQQIKPKFLGYSKAASAIKDGQIDAMWVVSGFPTRAVMELAATSSLSFISLNAAAIGQDFYTKYPFYQKVEIPMNSYDGQSNAYHTFSDATLWVVNEQVSAEVVLAIMQHVFSKEGISYLSSITTGAATLNPKTSLESIKVPMHPGAVKFYKSLKLL